MKKNTVSRGTAAALCVLTAVTAFNAAYLSFQRYFNEMMPGYQANNQIYSKLAEIRATVDTLYVGDYNLQDAVDGAAAGFVVGVGDRWSSYLSAEEAAAYSLSFAGQAEGVGLSVIYVEGEDAMRIYEVAPGSAADEAGVTTEYRIVGAGELTVAQDGYEAVVDAITGEAGTEAEVHFRRADGSAWTATLTRGVYDQKLVTGHMLSDGKTGFIRLYNFRMQSEEQFAEVLGELIDQGAEQLVFDVRNDPGGSVDSLCKILDLLLPEGKTMIMRTKAGEEHVYESDAEAVELPMAVLVNASSISAAEFFAAALQEYDKAIIVGEQTIGKGYSQRTYTLSDGSALRLSDQEYFTPQGRSLIGQGVTPDVPVTMDAQKTAMLYLLEESQDDQLKAALSALDEMSAS